MASSVGILSDQQALEVLKRRRTGRLRCAADGFNLIPPALPSSLAAFVDAVVPELQRRGLFRAEYEGTTLREHLGLERPLSRHAERTAVTA